MNDGRGPEVSDNPKNASGYGRGPNSQVRYHVEVPGVATTVSVVDAAAHRDHRTVVCTQLDRGNRNRDRGAGDQGFTQLPVGRDATFAVHRCQQIEGGNKVLCSVIKDGGDDPDVTHGAEICVTASPLAGETERVRVTGGPGVGTVTKPGTGIEVGQPAVTRVPRRMIIGSVLEALEAQGQPESSCFEVEISVPGGEEIAQKTTNARLGGWTIISI